MKNKQIEITLSDIKNCPISIDNYRNLFTDNFVSRSLVMLNAENTNPTKEAFIAFTVEDILKSNFVSNLGTAEEAPQEQTDEAPSLENPDQAKAPANDVTKGNLATLVVPPDGLFADILLLQPADGEKVTKQDILNLINSKGITSHINYNYIDRLILRPVYNTPFLIARGVEPIAGTDGYVKFHFDTENSFKPTVDANGNVDFKNILSSLTAKKGQLLCEIIPPTPPISGKNVYGKTIPGKEPKKASIIAGNNTSYCDDTTKIVADCDGQIVYKSNKISVNKELCVKDVNNETGNIDFAGNVRVTGDVFNGYSVTSGGNIIVQGSVEGATLVAEGDITISNGMNGNEIGSATAGGKFTAKFIENATVTAIESIEADMALNSQLFCEGSILFEGRRGCIIGGECSAGTQIRAQTIGNASNIATSLTINILPRLKKELTKLDTEINEYESVKNNLGQIYQRIYGSIEETALDVQVLGALKTIFHYCQIDALQKPLNLRKSIILQRIGNLTSGNILVKNCINANVLININGYTYKTASSYQFTNIRTENGQIIFAPYTK